MATIDTHRKNERRLEKHPDLHLPPTRASWPNRVETWLFAQFTSLFLPQRIGP